jgi:hypothetical protein
MPQNDDVATDSIRPFSGPYIWQDDGKRSSVEERGLGDTPRKSSLEVDLPKEIPIWKRKRTLKLLRRYIPTVDIASDNGSLVPECPRPLEDSDPSLALRRCSSKSERYGTYSSVGSTPSSVQTKVFSATDGREIELKRVGHLPGCLRARKALMRYIGACTDCSRKRTKVNPPSNMMF